MKEVGLSPESLKKMQSGDFSNPDANTKVSSHWIYDRVFNHVDLNILCIYYIVFCKVCFVKTWFRKQYG